MARIPKKQRLPRLTKAAHYKAQYQFSRLLQWGLHAHGVQTPLAPIPDDPHEEEAARARYLEELETARRALLAHPPSPHLFHDCLARYGPLALAWMLNARDVLVEMTRWWGLAKWGDVTARDSLTRVLEPIGNILTRGVPGRDGSLTPTVKDKDRERAAGIHYKRKYDATRRAERARLTTASPEDLEKAVTSPSGPTRKAAEQVKRRRNKAGR